MAEHDRQSNQRGRHAERPTQITQPGWRDVCLRVKEQIARDNVTLIAAGVAFYGVLAIFPAIAALISLWGLVFDPHQIQQQIVALGVIMPPEASHIIEQQARKIIASTDRGISVTAVGSTLFAVLTASRGVANLMDGMNIVYNEVERRSLFKLIFLTLAFTSGLIVMMVIALTAIVFVPMLAGYLSLGSLVSALITYLRWPLLVILVMFAIATLYRYGPHRANPRWEWVSVGSVSATLLWILGSIGLSLYVSSFSSFDKTYGFLGAVMVLLIWFWLSAFSVLMGGELNSEMERQTKRDSTVRPDQPMGQRQAYSADTVGKKP